MTTQVLATEPIVPSSGYVLTRVGDPEGLLLAGPAAIEGPESLDAYADRLGPSPVLDGEAILSQIRASGLQGRGGGGFPLWRKLETALASPGAPLLVVNCSESEPASRKDWTICSYRPHTVLEGAAAMARVLGAREVVIHLHGDSIEPRGPARSLARARLPGR